MSRDLSAYEYAGNEVHAGDSYDISDYIDLGIDAFYAQTGDFMSEMSDFTSEMMQEMSDSLRDLMEEMGLDGLSDNAVSVNREMDPADLKMMKINSADSYSRPMTESETARLEELRQAYLEQGYFPKKELTLIDSPEKYKKGVAFYAERSTFFLPEKELTDEQLLELIDFKEKREYSLAKISEEIAEGSYEYVKTEPEKDAAQQGRVAQQGTSGTVLGADTATQEWQIAYEGDVSIRCAAVAENGLYVGGFTTDGQARVEYLPYGSGTPETFFEDFAENGEVYSLCTAPDGSIYAGLKGLAVPGAEHGWLPVIYHISPEGTLLNSFTVGEQGMEYR